MNVLDTIVEPYRQGRSCIVLTGRDLNDLDINPDGQIQPLIEILRTHVLSQCGMILVEYTKSRGVVWDSDLNTTERNQVSKTLGEIGITSNNGSKAIGEESEFVRIMRSLIRLSQTDHRPLLRDGVPMRFMLIIGFAEHIMPCLQTGTHTEEQMLAIETALQLAKSLAVRKSGNYVVFSEARTGLLEGLIYQNIPIINLPQPSVEAKTRFLEALRKRYPKASSNEALTDQIICNLSANTPNRSLEGIFLASERTGERILARDVFAKRQSDLLSLSEGTLHPVDESRIAGQSLVGRTVQKPMQILARLADGLKRGDKNCLRNILLCGSPSSGKTVLAHLAACKAGVPSFTLVSPKSGIVGESERKTRVMLNLLKQQGGFGLIDEAELILPLDRGKTALDGGVTENLMGQLQSFLSDPSLAGKCALIGTSNKPNSISEAMRQRWIIVPVFFPLKEDYPEIVYSIARGLNPAIPIQPDDEAFKALAKSFHDRGANPREILDQFTIALSKINGDFSVQHIGFVADTIIPSVSKLETMLSDYCALSYTRNQSFLPWYDEESRKPDPNFPYPPYIREILADDFMIDQAKLQARIRELEPHANI